MSTEQWVVLGLLFAVVLWSSMRSREAASPADVSRIERKIDYLLRRFDIEPRDAEAIQPSAEVLDLIRAGQKIGAVKKLREDARLTLREAKEIVDRYEGSDRPA